MFPYLYKVRRFFYCMLLFLWSIQVFSQGSQPKFYQTKGFQVTSYVIGAVVISAALYGYLGGRSLFMDVPNFLLKTEHPLDREKVRALVTRLTNFRWVYSHRKNEDLFADEYHNYIQVKYKYGKKYKHRVRFLNSFGYNINPLYAMSAGIFSHTFKKKNQPLKKNYPEKTAKAILNTIQSEMETLDQ